MAEIGRLLGDGDGVRITDGDGAYIVIPGDLVEAEPPDRPTGLSYDKATGTVSWDDQNDAAEWRLYANTTTEGPHGARTRSVGTATYPTTSLSDSALAAGESRAYELRAWDDYSELEGRGKLIFASSDDSKL